MQSLAASALPGVDRLVRPFDSLVRFVLLLYRHPGTFARFVAPRLRWPSLAFMTVTYGLEMAVSFLERDAAREKPLISAATWPEWWAWVLGLSVYLGVLVTAFGDVFFRLRIALAGARWPTSGRVLRTYLSIAQIAAWPTLLIKLGETCYFATPGEAGPGWASIAVAVVFALWAQVAEYRATITAFGASPLRARIVFFWLPVTVVALAVAVLALVP